MRSASPSDAALNSAGTARRAASLGSGSSWNLCLNRVFTLHPCAVQCAPQLVGANLLEWISGKDATSSCAGATGIVRARVLPKNQQAIERLK